MNELKNKNLTAAFALLGVVLFVIIFYGGYKMYLDSRAPAPPHLVSETPLKEPEFREVLEESVSGVDPKPLQDYFADKVAKNIKDDATKSAIYWITHRYFDNGGDIYEIYDFIEARPEVSFLKDAEKVYPTIFADIREKKVKNYSRESLIALLAYYDAIDAHGYADIAIWGMAANKYAELAQGALRMYEADPKARYPEGAVTPLGYMTTMSDRSLYYIERVHTFLKNNTQNTGTLKDLYMLSVIPDDLLVGLNQYSAAVENLRVVKHVFSTPFPTDVLYEFNAQLAKDRVPRLYFFTNYLYASALVNGGTATKDAVRVPLDRVLEYVEATPAGEWRGSVQRVIGSKSVRESGMYSYDTVKTLASLHENFALWLMKQGWTEADLIP